MRRPPDAEGHPTLFWQAGVLGVERALDLDRALHGVERGGELGQDVVTWGIDDPAPVRAHEPADLLTSVRDRADRRRLVGGHEPAVAHRIGRENRGKMSLGRVHLQNTDRMEPDGVVFAEAEGTFVVPKSAAWNG